MAKLARLSSITNESYLAGIDIRGPSAAPFPVRWTVQPAAPNAFGREKEEIARVVACRGSIKAGQKLSLAEMQSLIDRLFATENPYTCPHGRPIVIRMTVEELAHKFGRS